MQMLYNSDSFVVVRFDVDEARADAAPLGRGGYEIVDKLAGKELYIGGLLAERFRDGVERLAATDSQVEDFDDFIAGWTALAQQPVRLH